MTRNPRRWIAALLAIAASAAASAAPAAVTPSYDKVRSERWRCRLCPFELASHAAGHWTLGVIAVEDAEPRFGRGTGLDEDGMHLDLGTEYRRRAADGQAVSVRGDNLGLASRDLMLDYRNTRGGVALRWREIPHKVATDGRSPYLGRTLLSLPEQWVRGFDTARMTALGDTANAFDHGTRRRKAAARASFRPRARWRLDAGYARATRKGVAETHGDFLYQAVGLAEPVDHETEEIDGGVRFETGNFLLAGTLRGSRFENGVRALQWENPWSEFPETGRKGLAPDNDARSTALVSRWTRGRTSINGSLSWGRMRQDAPFLPYTSNPAVGVAPLPADSLRGRARTHGASFAVVSRPMDRLRLSLKHRRSERDNDTGVLLLTPVLGDLFATAPRRSRVHAHDRTRTELRFDYRLSRRTRLRVGADAARMRRAPAEIARNDARGGWVELLATDLRGFRLAIRLAEERRDASPFRDVTANNPRTRRFHQAEREQRTWTFALDYRFPSAGLSVGLDADYRRNDYPDSALGLRHDEDRGWSADLTYAPGAGMTVSAFRTVREAGARTAGSSSFGVADWWYGTQDTVDTDGVHLELRDVGAEGLQLSLAYTRSSGRGRYGTEFAAMDAPFPELRSEHTAVDVRARYRLSRRSVLVARYYLEDYGAADWALDGVGVAAARNLISFGRRVPDYANGLFSISIETRP